MTIIAERWPEILQPRSCSFTRARDQVRPTSPASRVEAIVRKGRPLWVADLAWSCMPGDVSLLRYYIDGICGQSASVLIRDFSVPLRANRGVVTAQSTAAVGGTSVSTTGWLASTSVLAAGDYVQIGRRLYLAAAAVTSNGSGAATITLDRPLLSAVAIGDTINYRNPACEMRLVDDEWTGQRDAENALLSLRATFVETAENLS